MFYTVSQSFSPPGIELLAAFSPLPADVSWDHLNKMLVVEFLALDLLLRELKLTIGH